MHARLDNPLMTVPSALKSLVAFGHSADNLGVPQSTTTMVHLRASQINGCAMCVDMHAKELKQQGVSDERIAAVAAWRETPYFSDAERAALALAEAGTRLSDREDPVPDHVWDEARRHYDDKQLAGLVVAIAAINAFNRINAITRQIVDPDVAW